VHDREAKGKQIVPAGFVWEKMTIGRYAASAFSFGLFFKIDAFALGRIIISSHWENWQCLLLASLDAESIDDQRCSEK